MASDSQPQQDDQMNTLENGNAHNNTQATIQTENFPSSYVFLRTPKKLGDKLQPDGEEPPEGWGIYLEESFRVHHLLVLVLLVYGMASLAFGAYWYRKYGMVGPQSGLGSFVVSSWMISLATLFWSVWFKWAD
jgi:hypothetical protein